MPWYAFIAHFFAGVFLANGVPHLVQGISGKRFPTPFASPPGVGESSPLVNVIWGLVSLLIGYLLIFGVGHFFFGITRSAAMVAIGALVASILLARYFGRVRRPA